MLGYLVVRPAIGFLYKATTCLLCPGRLHPCRLSPRLALWPPRETRVWQAALRGARMPRDVCGKARRRSECGVEVYCCKVCHPPTQGKRKKVLKVLWREQPSLLTGSRSSYPASHTESRQWMIFAKKLAQWYRMQAARLLSNWKLQCHMRRSRIDALAACRTDPPENKVPHHLSMISSL
jgi:hypothetical protein